MSNAICAQPIHQDAQVLWGQKTKATPRTSLHRVVGQDSDGLYITKFNAHSWYGHFHSYLLEHYDHQMNLKASQGIPLDFTEGKRELAFVLYIKQQLYIFTAAYDKAHSNMRLYVQEADMDSMKAGASRLIAEAAVPQKLQHHKISFGHTFSPDSSALLVYHTLPSAAKQTDAAALYVFDQHVRPVWQQQVSFPDLHVSVDWVAPVIDNNFQVYMLTQTNNKQQTQKAERYQLLHYQHQGDVLHRYSLLTDEHYIKDARLVVSDKHQVICAGFYADRLKGNIAGSFHTTISSAMYQATPVVFQPLEIRHFAEHTKGDRQRVPKLKNYVLKDIVLRTSGGIALVAEQVERTVITDVLSGLFHAGPSGYCNACGNILLADIGRDGELHWAQQIYKHQPSVNNSGLFSSYALLVVEDKLCFIFNDNPQNLIRSRYTAHLPWVDNDKVYPLRLHDRSTIVAMVEVDAYGNKKKSPLFMRYDSEVITRPQVCQQVSATEMVIFGQHRRSQKIGKLTFRQPVFQITSK